MHKTNLEEMVIVKIGSILQSLNATKEDVSAAYMEAECDRTEESNDEKINERHYISNCL